MYYSNLGEENLKYVESKLIALLLLCFISTVSPSVKANYVVGVRSGDWIRLEATYGGSPPAQQVQWMRLEVLSTTSTTVTLNTTTRMIGGAEASQVGTVDVVTGAATPQFEGLVISAYSNVGDFINMGGGKSGMIIGETTRTYAGVGRAVFQGAYLLISHYYTCYWDKQTGILAEFVAVFSSYTMTAVATETNMWAPSGGLFLGLNLWLWLVFIVVIVGAVATVVVLILRRRKRPTSQLPPLVQPPPPAPPPPSM